MNRVRVGTFVGALVRMLAETAEHGESPQLNSKVEPVAEPEAEADVAAGEGTGTGIAIESDNSYVWSWRRVRTIRFSTLRWEPGAARVAMRPPRLMVRLTAPPTYQCGRSWRSILMITAVCGRVCALHYVLLESRQITRNSWRLLEALSSNIMKVLWLAMRLGVMRSPRRPGLRALAIPCRLQLCRDAKS